MPMLSKELQQPEYWLRQAQYFNTLWHQREEDLRLYEQQYDEVQRKWYQSERDMLLGRKNDCLLTVIRLIYDYAEQGQDVPIQLIFDEQERGYDGSGLFYSVSMKNNHFDGCHIPLETLQQGLTPKELAFFKIG